MSDNSSNQFYVWRPAVSRKYKPWPKEFRPYFYIPLIGLTLEAIVVLFDVARKIFR